MTVAQLIVSMREMPQEGEVWIRIGNHFDVVDSVSVDVTGDVVIHGEGSESWQTERPIA